MPTTFPWNQVNVMVQDNIIPVIKTQFDLSNALFLRMKGRQKTFTGGRRIVPPLAWRAQGALKWFAGTDTFQPTVRDPFTAAEFTPKNSALDLTIDWDEEMTVAGKQQVMDLMAAKGEQANITFKEGMGTEIFNDGTDPKAIAGLRYALKAGSSGFTPPTMTYGGISRSSTVNTWWNHNVDHTSYTTGATGTFAGNGSGIAVFKPINLMFANIKLRSGKAPTLIISNVGAAADVHYALMRNTQYQRPQQNSDLYKAGFDNFMFRSAAWVVDEKAPRASQIENVYFLYEPAVRLWVDSRANFAFEPFRKPHNQLARTAYILWRGELIIDEPRSCGVMSNVDTTGVMT